MKDIIDALKTIQGELKAPKNQYNNFGKYKYRSCEDILEGLKPCLAKTNCALTISDMVEMIGDRFYVKATATLHHGEESISANGYAREAEDKKGMDSAQITGATSSYARKYALNGLFAIDDSKDADHANDHGKGPAPKSKAPAPKQPQCKPKQPAKIELDKKTEALTKIGALAKFTTLTDEELKNALHLFATKGRALQSADDLTVGDLRDFYVDLKAEDSYIVADALKNREKKS
jgi:hypothetical protein